MAGVLDGSSLLAKTLRKVEDATGSCIIMTSRSRVDNIFFFFVTLGQIVRHVFVGINFHNVHKFTVHDQRHDCVRPLREHPFYRDLSSVIRMQVYWRPTSVRGQIPCEQGVTIAPFSAFHLKTLTSVHGSTSKEEGIVTGDLTVVFQFDARRRVLFFVNQEFQRIQNKELEIKWILSFVSHVRIGPSPGPRVSVPCQETNRSFANSTDPGQCCKPAHLLIPEG